MISVAHKILHLDTTTGLGLARVIALLSKERTWETPVKWARCPLKVKNSVLFCSIDENKKTFEGSRKASKDCIIIDFQC